MPRIADDGTRDRILAAARRLFYAHGIQAVGMAQVVEEAGCGKNLLYREFPSKADLVAAYLEDFARKRARANAEALSGLEDEPAQALVALTRLTARQVASRDFQGCAFRNYLREFRSYDDSPGRVATSWIRAARKQVDDLASQLDTDDPRRLADQVWLVNEGLWSSAPYPRRRQAGEAAVELVEELVAG